MAKQILASGDRFLYRDQDAAISFCQGSGGLIRELSQKVIHGYARDHTKLSSCDHRGDARKAFRVVLCPWWYRDLEVERPGGL